MLTRLLRRAVQADPSKAAIVLGARRLRYDELDDLAGRCATGLARLDIGVGDGVAVALPDGPEFVACLFGCARLGAVMLPLNVRSTTEEQRDLLVDAGARVVVADPSRATGLGGSGEVVVDFESLAGYPADSIPNGQFAGPVLILYTSGSTGTRKRLRCTQENLYWEARNFVETVGLTAADNILCTVPLGHSYGFGNGLLDAVYTGATLVLLEPGDAPFAARCPRVLELLREESIRFYPGVPYQFGILAALPGHRDLNLGSLKLCVSSGDVLPRSTFERFLGRYGLPIRSLYGSTEAGSISINIDPDKSFEFGSLGPPLRNVEIRVRDDAGRELPRNGVGHIWVKSPVVPPGGYENRPDVTALVFRDGYYGTGDVGSIDDRGHLVLVCRKASFVDVAGYKVDLGEVEEVLQGHPMVREAAAVGVEVPDLGTLIKAVVVAEAPPSQAEILAYCRRRLASFKVPRLLEFRDALPRSALGKVLKSELGDLGAYLESACPDDFERAWRSVAHQAPARQVEMLAREIRRQAARALQVEVDVVDGASPFHMMGFDSLRSAELLYRLKRLTGMPLPISILWNYPSIHELAAALRVRLIDRPDPAAHADGSPIATNRP
jgi:long-chain acyl-CoA synthetase